MQFFSIYLLMACLAIWVQIIKERGIVMMIMVTVITMMVVVMIMIMIITIIKMMILMNIKITTIILK